MDDVFFSKYKKTKGGVKGIPTIIMNKPLVVNTYEGTLGLELEIEAANALPRDGHLTYVADTTNTRWMSVQDGSLRGEAREYLFSGPATRKEVAPLVNYLFDVFKINGCRLANSNRCSTHVHVNMAGKTINQITSIIALWTTFEESLIAWNGEERVTNHFCLSSKNSVSLIEAWNSYLSTGHFDGIGQDRHGLKYMALNILPLFRKGSLEFRCGGAPNGPEKVIQWATFIDKMCEFACTRYANPFDLASDLSERGGYAILADICEETHVEFFNDVVGGIGVDAFDTKSIEGFRNIQQIALGYPWHDWMKLINRPYVPNPFETLGRKKIFRAEPGLAPPQRRTRGGGDVEAFLAQNANATADARALERAMNFARNAEARPVEVNWAEVPPAPAPNRW